ncbi:MAG: NUDIX hydrolase [Syntrophorhabdaceae bacterium]|nr:NUDIX hydrolase [Syntrophorhabdaceae bacterium]MDD5245266.1 NUDIX hydrolase [Syntrophorhabdaceae bacterium]
MKRRSYCNFCGRPLDVDTLEGKDRQVCKDCNEIYYENPLPVASVILTNRDREVLLVKREREPFKDMWCCPIGFAEVGESIEAAALRELKEETGIDGSIVQLIDVSSHKNSFYGDLLIVSFEAEKLGGQERAGDDAIGYGYFPVMNLPKLAFDSQEKAMQKFIELKKDLWSMHDSLEVFVEGTIQNKIMYPETLLSDELTVAVQENSGKIVDLWLNDISTNPSTRSYRQLDREDLLSRAMFILGQFEQWLKGVKAESEFKNFYYTLGYQREQEGIPMEELVSSLSLLKKHIWMFTYSFGVWEKAVDIYRMFELGERLVYFFDKIVYYTVMGYRSAMK